MSERIARWCELNAAIGQPASSHIGMQLEEAYSIMQEQKAQLARCRAALEKIGKYEGEGPPTTPWQEIVKDLGAEARKVLGETET